MSIGTQPGSWGARGTKGSIKQPASGVKATVTEAESAAVGTTADGTEAMVDMAEKGATESAVAYGGGIEAERLMTAE